MVFFSFFQNIFIKVGFLLETLNTKQSGGKHLEKEEDFTHNLPPQKSTPIPVWNDYNNYHDFFITLLSYGRKDNTSKYNIWDYEYV